MDTHQKLDASPVTLFYSYAHEDEKLRGKLERHLSLLRQQGLITEWHDRQIVAGTDWTQVIDTYLNNASVILLLISSDFLNSDYCSGKEMQRALERHQANEARVIPILLRPVDWKNAPFAHLQMLPTGARAITDWRNQDKAFADVAAGIRRAVEDLTKQLETSEQREASSRHTKPAPPGPAPVFHNRPWKQWHWLWTGIIILAVLFGVIGSMLISPLWHPHPSLSVTTPSPCAAAPTLTGPPDGQTVNVRTITFTWEAPPGCVPDGYTVRINADYDPEAKPWIVDTGWAPTDYTYTFSTDGTYYWHIRACQPCSPFHPGSWAIRSFTIHT